MKVEISELKAKLSVYIDAVKRGETVNVLDGNTLVAQLAPLPDAGDDFQVVPASRSPREIRKAKGVRPKRSEDVVDVLTESRGDH